MRGSGAAALGDLAAADESLSSNVGLPGARASARNPAGPSPAVSGAARKEMYREKASRGPG
jgi:hypothetical protein